MKPIGILIFILIVGGCMGQNATQSVSDYPPYTPPKQHLYVSDIATAEQLADIQFLTNGSSKKEITLGMTKEQVIASWGSPKDKNRSVGSWGVHEQWVYHSTYLYFENGILTSYQD
jgi:hypothetical protein